ncbi:hypothetical protein [Cellulomonas sp. S1-8]|uniref:hypothetical protein n=1 Tax=Cellulomonas sp. S1-8 TaxID=2904790 RepID=UPI00224362B7|nr:hypothetical protein [Cellulomonas sp. S1-8]UZN02103.1 hypothetical protein OKX07_13535 [Cellulomonas sp. S1-8]
MGLEEDIAAARRQREAEASLAREWADFSPFTKSSPIVGDASPTLKPIISEVLDHLRFDEDVVVDCDPEGLIRVRQPGNRRAKKLFGGEKLVKETGNAKAMIIPVGSQGKDTDNLAIWILRDGRVALVENGSTISPYREDKLDAASVRAAIVAALAGDPRS